MFPGIWAPGVSIVIFYIAWKNSQNSPVMSSTLWEEQHVEAAEKPEQKSQQVPVQKRSSPPPTPSKKSPETKVPKTQELTVPTEAPPKMPAVTAVATPQNAPAPTMPTPALADPAALFASFMAFMQQQQQVQQQPMFAAPPAPPCSSFLTPEAKHAVASPLTREATRDTPPSEAADAEANDANEEDEGREEEQEGDGADVIVMPHGSKVSWFKYHSHHMHDHIVSRVHVW